MSFVIFLIACVLVALTVILAFAHHIAEERTDKRNRWADGTPLPYTAAARIRVWGVFMLRASIFAVLLLMVAMLIGV